MEKILLPDRPDDAPPDKWKNWYKSLHASCVRLVKRVEELEAYVMMLQAEKKQQEEQKVKQLQVIQETLNERNQAMNGVLEENNRLKAELRALKNGHND